jgi:cell division protein FtsB
MNWPTLALVLLIALLQYPLWLGKGGWIRVWDYERQVAGAARGQPEAGTAQCRARCRGARPEIGLEAIEERARYELGMIKDGEVFVQVPQKKP